MDCRPLRTACAAVATVALGALGACGADAGDDLVLSPEAERGRELARTNGCASCHGSRGEGGISTAFVGLLGSTVELEDGTTVVADADYITESIVDPNAKVVAGADVPMPPNDLSPDEVEAIVAYVRELAEPVSDSTAQSARPHHRRRSARRRRRR